MNTENWSLGHYVVAVLLVIAAAAIVLWIVGTVVSFLAHLILYVLLPLAAVVVIIYFAFRVLGSNRQRA